MSQDKIKPLGFIFTNGGKVKNDLNAKIYACQDDIYPEAFCVDPDYLIKTISKQDDKYCYFLEGKMVGTTFDGEIIWGWKLVDMMPRSEAEKNDYQYQPPPEGFAPEFTLTISDKTEQGGFIDLDKERERITNVLNTSKDVFGTEKLVYLDSIKTVEIGKEYSFEVTTINAFHPDDVNKITYYFYGEYPEIIPAIIKSDLFKLPSSPLILE